jgi:NAD(P)-dependent dehydrogenase (short-subunit alcohol dehydrogenase family)
VNTASTAGLVAAPMIGLYNVAKFGVVALSETLAAEDSPIGASLLCPGVEARAARAGRGARDREPTRDRLRGLSAR